MPTAATPREFALGNLKLVRRHWAGVRDADVESIHQARIALRRIRAALQVLYESDSDEIELCRYLGRALGRVRDLDVMQELFIGVGTRLPAAASAVGAIRRNVDRDRSRAARRLIKTLDDVKLRPLARLPKRQRLPRLSFWTDWRVALPSQLAQRTASLREAIDLTPATYMPNRLHRVRIAMKKLRYTLEVTWAAGVSIDQRLMRDLRKTQDLLGGMHDLHVAGRLVDQFDAPDKTVASELNLLEAVMTADLSALHAKYLSRRDRLRAMCDYSAKLAASRPATWTMHMVMNALPAAGLVALPVAVWRLGTASPEGSRA